MLADPKADGEPQERWPDWYLMKKEPIIADVGAGVTRYSYVVLPQQEAHDGQKET